MRLTDHTRLLLGLGAAAVGAVALSRHRRRSALYERFAGALVPGGRSPRGVQLYGVQRTASHVHQGIDIGAPAGSPVHAAGDGKVAAVWPDGKVSGYGNTVVLQHPDGSQTLYAHMQEFAPGLSVGDVVEAGQAIGAVGSTQLPRPPTESSPHLHFEAHKRHTLAIREDNPERFEPLSYLSARGVEVSS